MNLFVNPKNLRRVFAKYSKNNKTQLSIILLYKNLFHDFQNLKCIETLAVSRPFNFSMFLIIVMIRIRDSVSKFY